jgi:hypothetical protein
VDDTVALLSAIRQEFLALEPSVFFVRNQMMEMQVGMTLFRTRAGARAARVDPSSPLRAGEL